MRLIFKIVIFMMLLVLLTAENCSDNYSESEQADRIESKVFQELEDNFISAEMDAEHLKALEKRAVQKVHELVDYLNIYADSGLDVQFRKQARQMISEVFVTEQDLQEFFELLELEEDSGKVFLFKQDDDTLTFNIESIRLKIPFKYSELIYKGQLTYQLMCSNEFTSNLLGVRAIKSTKSFGNEKLDVWELFFEPISRKAGSRD